jgi:hypothetical protein
MRLAINPEHRTLDVKLHFIREKVERKELEVVYINTNYEIADMMTQPLAKRPFQHLRIWRLDCLGAQLRGRNDLSADRGVLLNPAES